VTSCPAANGTKRHHIFIFGIQKGRNQTFHPAENKNSRFRDIQNCDLSDFELRISDFLLIRVPLWFTIGIPEKKLPPVTKTAILKTSQIPS
jgi:hypothetical protein